MTKRGGARPGAGRPAIEAGLKRVKVSATLRHATWLAVSLYVERTGCTVSQAIDEMLHCAAGQSPFADALERTLPAARRGAPITASHPLAQPAGDHAP